MNRILGVDVSSAQGVIDWSKLAGAGVRFAIIKCTQGNEKGRDPFFDRNVVEAKACGIYVGAYHFAYHLPTQREGDGRSPKEEAESFWAHSRGLGLRPGEFPPAFDCEWPPHFEPGTFADLWQKWHVDAGHITRWALEFVAEVERLWGRAPMLYTYPDFWRSIGAGDVGVFARCPLWSATYGVGRFGAYAKVDQPAMGDRPFVPRPWDDWTFWQFSGDGGKRLPGCATDIDRNVFRGDLDGLRRLALIDPEAVTVEELPDPPSEPTIVHPDIEPSDLAHAIIDGRNRGDD